MRDQSLLDEIIRLRKLQLDTSLSSIVEEAAQLLAREQQAEAEALSASLRLSRPVAIRRSRSDASGCSGCSGCS